MTKDTLLKIKCSECGHVAATWLQLVVGGKVVKVCLICFKKWMTPTMTKRY